ncbi:hypothetical protein M9H77_22467 [Catharanthus roseus]|uniref:Uncharacterized protein n=1 Tax=Catharanthus roseus TaxID=4058 RepID=A0ACC0AQJ5_CATRO|nr:hypothetical protein M9H77_22467 [Catharanthus roseus]
MLGSATLDLYSVDRGRSIVGGLGLRRYCWVRRGPPARIAQGGLSCIFVSSVPRGTRVPYPAAVDLAEGYELQIAGRLTAKVTLMEGTPEFDISFKFGMLRVSYNYKLKDSIPKFSREFELIFKENGCRVLAITRLWKDSFDFGPRTELFLEQLNDIYETLQYEGARRVTFAAFRSRGAVKDWWLRISEARVLRNQLWMWEEFQEEFKQEYIPYTEEHKTRQFVKGLRVDLQHALAPLPPTSFAATVEAATRIEIADQMAKQRTVAMNTSFYSHKQPGQRRWRPQYLKKPRNRMCFLCGKIGHFAKQCPVTQPTSSEMSRGVGRPPNMVGASVGQNNKL